MKRNTEVLIWLVIFTALVGTAALFLQLAFAMDTTGKSSEVFNSFADIVIFLLAIASPVVIMPIAIFGIIKNRGVERVIAASSLVIAILALVIFTVYL